MLSLPVFAEIDGITVFRDDVDPSRFYYLASDISIKRGDDGTPMFTFLHYQFPIEHEGKEKGGGYLVFTTEMTESNTVLERSVRPVLQQRLRSELQPGDIMPDITLAPVDFTDGEVRLIMMQNDEFIKNVTLGRPSLFANNTASVAVELNDDAATLFFEALKHGASIAAIEYNLTFPVRLPAIQIIGHVDSDEVKEAVMTYTEQTVVDGSVWGDDKREERQRTSISETMESQGLVKLDILKGSVDLPDDDVESLRAFAFRAMDEFIKSNFLKGGTVETPEDRKSQWMEFLNQDIHKTFDLNVSYRDVINREYNPSAQINPSFLGAPVEDLVHMIDLQSAPWFFNTLEVVVDTNLDFAKYDDLVHSVVGHLSYDQVKPDGTRIVARESVAFRADDTTPKSFKTRLAGLGRDTYHVDIEVNYKSGPTLHSVIERRDTNVRNLTLNVPNPGIMEISFTAEPNAFGDQLPSIEVEVEYGDPARQVPTAIESVTITAQQPEAKYRRVIYAPWDQPYRYRYTYNLKSADDGSLQRSTTAWMESSSAARFQKVPTPFDQQFALTIIPSVDWREVAEVLVDLEYFHVAQDYRVQRTVRFSNESAATRASQTWKFPLRDPSFRRFRYAEKWLMQNGAVSVREWREVDTRDQMPSIVVGNAPGGVVTLTIDPSDVGIGSAVRRAIVHLTFTEPQQDSPDTESLVFRDGKPLEWTVARRDARRSDYTYTVDYFMNDGTRRELRDQPEVFRSIRETLFLPPPPTS